MKKIWAFLVLSCSRKNIETIDLDDEIKLTIDYTKTIEKAIVDGKYKFKNSDINDKNFPVSSEMIGKKVNVSAKLFNFNRDISSYDAISEMNKDGYRPATLMELLFLGILFPGLQRQFPIVAFGSFLRDSAGFRCAPCLDVDDSGRKLRLGWFDGGDWNARYLFLGIRKSA